MAAAAAAAAITHAEYNDRTEALEVAEAFASGITGKNVVVTGVNKNGIGFSTAEAFPAATRPSSKSASTRSKASFPTVDYRPLKLDLSSQKTVRAAAAEFLSWAHVPTVDMLVHSAGVMLVPERTLTADGVEMHLAPFAEMPVKVFFLA
ncbi:MAG: hypothetical protein M1819_004413 [Sarea resinae]|nr:MAG: hypothetical protein M1819_004413 [Sarea resinae]